MVVSHRFKYVFVELPHTGTTAIAAELVEHYGGVRFLRKHALYSEFLKASPEAAARYFVFSTIRNPLDEAVSIYFRFKNNLPYYTTRPRGLSVTPDHLRRLRFVNDTGADFSTYFMRFYHYPYDNWSSLRHTRFDYVIRFEDLQGGFAEVLHRLGLDQRRPLPASNVTRHRAADFSRYYEPPTYARAQFVFGPFMRRWGYDFPPAWGPVAHSWFSELQYLLLRAPRYVYWTHLRWSPGLAGRLYRRLQGSLQP